MEQSHGSHSITLGGSATTETALDNSVASLDDAMSIAETVTLGQTNIETTLATGGYAFHGHLVATPIHTSSHYQPFETPYLYELVGGDRNMEQTNLVVTPDGKTWDEVTRDTSYIGNITLHTSHGGGHFAGDQKWKPSLWRGVSNGHLNWGNKDFAIAWDRWICLRDGEYLINGTFHASTTTDLILHMQLNGHSVSDARLDGDGVNEYHHGTFNFSLQMERGWYLQLRISQGQIAGTDPLKSRLDISRIN